MNVTVEGTPDDFVVKFDIPTDRRKRILPFSLLWETMLFGGYFVPRRLKSEEAGIAPEKEFWRHVENAVLFLGNSGKT